jgi:lipoyl(octanoyl) transferase
MECQRLGTVPYREAWALQEELRQARLRGDCVDQMLLLEHPSVITMGRQPCDGDLFSSAEALAADGIEVVKINRGGRATYHGPGQIVGYFICDLRAKGIGVEAFVRAIESLCIAALGDAGISAARDPHHPGLWVGREKIVALGLHVSRGVTQHGFALNVSCDLAAYRHLLACGIRDRGVTSAARLLPAPPSMAQMEKWLIAHAGRVLGYDAVKVGSGEGERLGV